MAAAEVATLVGAVGLGGVITAAVNGFFGKKAVAADVESKTVQNALALVEPYRVQVADVRKETQDHLAELRLQLSDVRTRNTELSVELKATREEVAQVTRREREHLAWQGEMTAWSKSIQAMVSEFDVHVPDPPDPPPMRREFTRRTDFPIVGDER